MTNGSYVFKESWIEILNLAPLLCGSERTQVGSSEDLNVPQYYTECFVQNNKVGYFSEFLCEVWPRGTTITIVIAVHITHYTN